MDTYSLSCLLLVQMHIAVRFKMEHQPYMYVNAGEL